MTSPGFPSSVSDKVSIGNLYVGTAGFTNAHWAGNFYPPHAKKSEDQLDCYQETFGIVEVNSTFYGTPSAETIASWRRRAAEGFRFALKVPRTVTHEGALASDPAIEALKHFVDRAKGLAPHLGLLLFQCSRGLRASAQTLHRVAEALRELPSNCRVALELRDAASHVDPAVLHFLRAHNWALVQHPNSIGRATSGNSSAGQGEASSYALEPLRDVTTADFAYVRLHGDNDTHSYCYSDAELAGYAETLHAWRRRGLDLFCFLLNDSAKAAMPHNAKRLMELTHALASEAVPQGPKLKRQRSLSSFFTPSQKAKVAKLSGDGGVAKSAS